MQASFPYQQYTLYVTYHCREKRRYANLVAPNHRMTIAYAKYLLEVKLGRFLIGDEEADHIDGDKMNDSADNLQVLTKAKNLEKSIKRVDYGTKICVVCGVSFPATRNKKIKCCSRKCGGIASTHKSGKDHYD